MTNYRKFGLAAAMALLLSTTALAADVSPLITPQPSTALHLLRGDRV